MKQTERLTAPQRPGRLTGPVLCRLACVLFAAAVLVQAPPAMADGWHTPLPGFTQSPEHFIVVDKEEQILHLVERHSPPTIVASFPCTTGQRPGDKLVEGDQKTPEGVYFIERIIRGGLDREMYGGLAYTLNYPNPVDRLRGKTGYGIWLHSKGRDIVPMETQGCIALNLADIATLEPNYARGGIAVAVAHDVLTDSPQADEQAQEAVRLTHEWVQAWASRSPDMFDFYDPAAYSVAQGSAFSAFRGQKERLFRTLPWIHTFAADIRVLNGPGYWVTWFDQYYRAPNMTVEGVRRLYWQQGPDGRLKIVGMEWKPAQLNLEQRYVDEYVTPTVAEFVSEWAKAWETANLANYMAAYAPEARQGRQHGATAIEAQKRALWASKQPTLVEFSDAEISWAPEGLTVRMRQWYADNSGYADEGIKELVLAPHGAGWHILREDWRAAK